MGGLVTAWLVEIGIMSYRSATKGRPQQDGGGNAPWPADFMSVFIIYGSLSLIAEAGPDAARVAGAFGWALVLATVLNLYDPHSASISRAGQVTRGGTPVQGQPYQPVPPPGFTTY